MSDGVMQETRRIAFCEGEFLVKTLEGEEELRQAYRLRHRVFAERLKWVPEREDRLESDVYDAWSTSVGLFSSQQQLLGMVRMTPAPLPFMLESEFSGCLVGSHPVCKELDTAEITRLAVDPAITDRGLSVKVMRTLIKGSYQWCLANDVRYTYVVVENRLIRVLRLMGWPCRQIGEPVALPPADVLSIASLIDLDEFRANAALERPDILEWFSAVDAAPIVSAEPVPLHMGTSSESYDVQRRAA